MHDIQTAVCMQFFMVEYAYRIAYSFKYAYIRMHRTLLYGIQCFIMSCCHACPYGVYTSTDFSKSFGPGIKTPRYMY